MVKVLPTRCSPKCRCILVWVSLGDGMTSQVHRCRSVVHRERDKAAYEAFRQADKELRNEVKEGTTLLGRVIGKVLDGVQLDPKQ